MDSKPVLSLRAAKAWRWVLLCALATYSTIYVITSYYEKTHRIRIDYSVAPLRSIFLGVAYLLSIIFLLFGAPFLYRWFRGLVLVTWLELLVSVVFDSLW